MQFKLSFDPGFAEFAFVLAFFLPGLHLIVNLRNVGFVRQLYINLIQNIAKAVLTKRVRERFTEPEISRTNYLNIYPQQNSLG